jgi:hypothetical protein
MSLKTIFLEHLTNLKTHFMKYFPEEMKQYYWIKDPFTEKPPTNFTTTEEEQLINISSDSSLRMQFSSYSLLGFWNSIKDEYPEVNNKVLRILIPFDTSYLCEAGFLLLNAFELPTHRRRAIITLSYKKFISSPNFSSN